MASSWPLRRNNRKLYSRGSRTGLLITCVLWHFYANWTVNSWGCEMYGKSLLDLFWQIFLRISISPLYTSHLILFIQSLSQFLTSYCPFLVHKFAIFSNSSLLQICSKLIFSFHQLIPRWECDALLCQAHDIWAMEFRSVPTLYWIKPI